MQGLQITRQHDKIHKRLTRLDYDRPKLYTERRGRVVNTPDSYSRGLGIKSRPVTGYPVWVFVLSLSPSTQMPA
jgi:hypothetical protein